MSLVLIDSGTTYLKLVTVDNNRIVDKKEYSTYDTEEKVKIIYDYLLNVSSLKNEIDVAISTEMHGFILINEEGDKLCDYISWTHECTRDILDEIKNRVSIENIRKSGMPLKAGIPSTSLYELKKDTKIDAGILLTLGDYYIYRITGIFPSMHPTNAAATGLFDLELNEWNLDYISELGYKHFTFPKVEEHIIFEKTINGVLFKFHEAIGDQQAALLGSEIDKDKMSINMGTGSQISVISDSLLLSSEFQTRPFFNDTYLLTIPNIPCGRALSVYMRFFKEIISKYIGGKVDEDKVWEMIMADMHDNNYKEALDIDMSFFDNAITHKSQGSISNINESNLNIDNLSVSIMNQMSNNYSIAYRRLPLSNDYKKLVFSGGVARKNPCLTKKIALDMGMSEYTIDKRDALDGLIKYIQLENKC